MGCSGETLTESEIAELRYQTCSRKVPLGRAAAMHLAADLRAGGERMTAYRCPFALEDGAGDDEDEGHWHIGHVPSMRSLHRLARYLRQRHASEVC
jgi:hypothetical protein